LAQFSKERWPAEGPVRSLLAYLDTLHREAGQPSLSEIGKAVSLAPSTLSGFFTGTRMISRGNLELLVSYFEGDVEWAEQLRRRAATDWNTRRSGRTPEPEPPTPPGSRTPPADDEPSTTDGSGQPANRMEILVFDTAGNRLHRPNRLIGREPLLARVREALDRGDHVLLHGIPGSGKTAAAATLADESVRAGGGAYLWMRLGQADEEAVVAGLVQRFATDAERRRVDSSVGDARIMALHDILARLGVTLCVIDDVWHPATLFTLVRAMPDSVGVVATSRLKLSLPAVFEVGDLEPGDAVELLALHAQDDRLTESAESAALCQDLGRHPYAIEIAGRHLRQYAASPAELRGHISGAAHALEIPGQYAEPGRHSVEQLLDSTYAALDGTDAQRALHAFGAYRSGSMTVELLAIHVDWPGRQARDALNGLVDVSLARRVEGTTRFAIHDLTLSYARARQPEEQPGRTAIRSIHAFVTAYAKDYRLLAAELDNIISATELARTHDGPAFFAILQTLTWGGYLDDQGYALGLVRLLDAAIDRLRDAPEPDTLLLHRLLSKRGNAHFNEGAFRSAVDVYSEALALAPDPARQVVLLSVLGKTHAELGDHRTANDHFARATAIAEAHGDQEAQLRILEQRSVAAFRAKDYQTVREVTAEGIALSRKLGARTLEAIFLHNQGAAEFELGVSQALVLHEQAQALAVELGNDYILALTERTIGADYHAREDFAAAREHFLEALRLYHKVEHTEREEKLRQMLKQFGYLR